MTSGLGTNTDASPKHERKNSKETIHSGQFMVSDFEADDLDEEGIEIQYSAGNEDSIEEIQGVRGINHGGVITYAKPTSNKIDTTTVSIDASLTKLFQTMSLAYRQNITCPKWNCFKGIRLRWKDKIRLNNVIWRCWHMQYIQRKSMTVCQFALDVDIHTRPEAVVLEGKYWKRRMNAVTAEYRKWRVFYKSRLSGIEPAADFMDMSLFGFDDMDWSPSLYLKPGMNVEEGFFDSMDFTDLLFSTGSNPQPFPFPNPRELARSIGNPDLLQPGLVQLQPDLYDDDMIDFSEMLGGRGLPTVPEEDIFPEVEHAVGLPPPSSPPSVSTPTPNSTNIEYSARFTAISDSYTQPNEPPSPQIFSPQESFIPTRNSSSLPPNTSRTVIQDTQPGFHSNESKFCPINNQTDPQTRMGPWWGPQNDDQKVIFSESLQHSFVVPKTYPKKKQYSGVLQNSPTPVYLPTTNTEVFVGAQPVMLPLVVTSTPEVTVGHLQRPPLELSATSKTPLRIGQGAQPPHGFVPVADSVLLAHLLTTPDSCSTSTSPRPRSSSPYVSKIKGATISPRPYPETNASSGTYGTFRNATSNSSTSSSSSFGTYGTMRYSTSDSCTSSSSSNVSPITTVPSRRSLLLPNVSLSAVTPSSIKYIQAPVSDQVVNASMSFGVAPVFKFKGSPPDLQPQSPTQYSNAPSPPIKSFRPKNETERMQYKEHRRVCHINAEQKRRYNIKNNFDLLHSLVVPAVNHNPNAKISKAMMLHKGAEYIIQTKQERLQLTEQSEKLRAQIETLSSEISLAQSLLPATGAPVSHTRHNKIKSKFESYVREQTLSNPKYFILTLIARPLLDSFNSSVSTASVDDLSRSSMAWLDQHCSLNVLRPIVSNSMRNLSVTTNILKTPETLYEDIFRQVTKQEGAPGPPHTPSNKDAVSPVAFFEQNSPR